MHILTGMGFILLGAAAFIYCWFTRREFKSPGSRWTSILFSGMVLFFGGIWYIMMILRYIFSS